MGALWKDIRYKMLHSGSKLGLLIGINVVIFLAINIPAVLEQLFTHFGDSSISAFTATWLALPSYMPKLITRPWTVISYMFMHDGVFHILFNMLWLYWIGQIFEEYLGNKRTLTLYFLGGLSGAFFFVASYNLFPAYSASGLLWGSSVVGASACVMAIVVATATLLPDYTIYLMFLGPVKLKWLAIFFVVIDFLNVASANSGGEIAHLGGALIGFIYIKQLKRGNDWSAPINKIFTPSAKMKVAAGAMTDNRKAQSLPRQDEIDRILDKISQSGYDSLNKQRKKFYSAQAKMIVKKTNLTFFDKLVLWINYFFAAAILISYLAPIVDPRTLWVIAFFGLAYPPLLLFNILFIVYWLLRKRTWALLSFICILLGWKVLNNNIGFRLPVAYSFAADTGRLRIMNYNVHNFKRYGSRNDESTRHEILDIIDHQQPDIICFEEFFSAKRGQYDMVDSIKKILKSNFCHYQLFNANADQGYGMAIFSKYPVISKDVIWLTDRQNINQCLYADIKKNGRIFRMYALHLQSIHFEAEDYQYLSGVTKQGKADINSSRRIGSKLKRAFLKRSEQVSLIKKHMGQCPYPYLIAGDFNDTPSSYAVNQIAKGMHNAFNEKGSGLGRTYNGDFPNYQIDYIMASKAFEILTYA